MLKNKLKNLIRLKDTKDLYSGYFESLTDEINNLLKSSMTMKLKIQRILEKNLIKV